MFKSAISALSSSVFKTATNSIGQYAPSSQNLIDGAYSRLIQQGIANISYRSPILSDIAGNAFNIFQTELVKKKKVSDYVKSSDADWLRPKIKEKLGNVSQNKIDSEMIKIISKISSQIDKLGVEEAKKSEEFKEYSQYFDKFKQETSKPNDTTQQTGLCEEILNRIEANTKQTVNALETLSIKQNSNQTTNTSTINHQSFIDPITGMPSIKAGVGAIGGMVLSKIFDDKLIDKLANKAKKFLDPEESIVTKKQSAKRKSTKFGESASVEKMFPKDLFDLKKEILKQPAADNKELHKTLKKLKPEEPVIKPLINKVSDSRKIDAAINLIAPKIFKSVPLGKNIVNNSASVANKSDIAKMASALLKHTPLHTTVPHNHNIASTAIGAVASAASNVATAGLLSRFAVPLLAGAASLISLPVAAGIAGVGALGYGGYKLLEASDKQNQLVSDATKKIDINRLKVSSDKDTKSNNLEALTTKKTTLTKESKLLEKPKQPIILNNSSNPQSVQPNNVIVGMNVRNKESTFERVQMQDFWSRTT